MNENCPDTKKRILMVGRRCHMQRSEWGLYKALERRFITRILFIEDGFPTRVEDVPEYNEYDAWIWYIPFRDLLIKPGFQWSNYRGLRIMLDNDVQLNYSTYILPNIYLGNLPDVFHRNKFHILLCSGQLVRDRLITDGIPAYWQPKAYDPSVFFNLHLERQGICHYGTPYRPRLAMLYYVKQNNIPFEYIKCHFQELNIHLNRYIGCLICNKWWQYRGILGRYKYKLLHSIFPTIGITLEPSNESMLKNFETAGAGCAPIVDWIDELAELGFEDGKTMVAYNSFEELIEKLKFYLATPETLVQIGQRAMSLVQNRHTWDHRAEQLERIIEDNS